MNTNSKELEIIACGDEIIEDGHVDNVMAEDQCDLKQSTVHFSWCNGPIEPCLKMEFDKLEDAYACYNAYSRQIGFSIRKSHSRRLNDSSLVAMECVFKGRFSLSKFSKHNLYKFKARNKDRMQSDDGFEESGIKMDCI